MLNKQTINDEQLAFLTWPTFTDDEILKVSDVLGSSKVNYWTGEEGQLFEKEYAQSIGSTYAIALMNGTVALEASLAALGIGPGDEVITTCRTFIASASAVVMRGATPILADVDGESQNLTVATIAPLVTPKTKAIIVVHLAGWPCEMDAIMQFAKQHELYVIEDCAQAHGAQYKGRAVGTWGDVAAFSFCQDKIMTTGGEGGMITTSQPALWEKIWAMKDHGKNYHAVFHQDHPPGFKWLNHSFGTNWRMTEMQAAIGRLQLTKLPRWVAKRRMLATLLTEQFKKIPGLRVTEPSADIHHAYYKYYVFVQPQELKTDWSRDRIMIAITQKGIPCYSGICGEIYLEKAFKDQQLGPKTRLPMAKLLGETSLMFLVHPTLTEEHMARTIEVVKEVMQEAVL